MQMFYQIMGVIGAVLVIFYIFSTVKNRPDLFSKANLNKSFFTMGVLALGLIAFVAFLILMVRSG
jgi:hypothetical protein